MKKLREAMFAGIEPEDATKVIQMIRDKALKTGDLKAAKLFLDYLAPGRTGIVNVVRPVVVNTGDV